MDESTLNDLLECSVCLERLDDSKVLPCQHTFCRKCLEVIVKSQKELRCPECRILVSSKIDDLPPNVLLMRILGGLKNSSSQNTPAAIQKVDLQTSSQQQKQPLKENIIKQSENIIKQAQSPPNTIQQLQPKFTNPIPSQQQQQQHHQQHLHHHLRQNSSSGVQNIPKAFALYDFQSKEIGDLQFRKGDVILIKRKLDSNWLCGNLNGREGAFPNNYVQIIVPLPVPQSIALYDFKMGPNEEEGCLAFKKGTIINVLRRVDQNWAEGRIGSCIGIFPIAFTEMNSLAKQLLQQDTEITSTTAAAVANIKNLTGLIKITPMPHVSRNLPPLPIDTNLSDSTSSSSSALMSPNSTCSSSSNSMPSSPINQAQKTDTSQCNKPNIKYRNAYKEKRNSLNSLMANTNLSVAQSNRHSAEILSIPNSSINEPLTVNNQTNQNLVNFSTVDQPTVNRANTANKQILSIDETNQLTNLSRVNVLKQHPNAPPNLPWSYMALYPYKPKKNDELELKKGCVYIVTERCLDGWFKGKNWLEKSGVFPGNYVTPLRTRDHQQLMHQRKNCQSNNIQPINTNTSNVANLNNILPELPPRTVNITAPTCSSSVFSKPISEQVESLFGRKLSLTLNNDSQSKSTTTQKDIKEISNQKSNSSITTTSSVGNLMKRLTNIKHSKTPSTISSNSTKIDNPVFEDTNKGAAGMSKTSLVQSVHVRSGSCPSQLLQNLPGELKENISGNTSNIDSAVFGSHRVKGQKERPSIQSIRGVSNVVGNGTTSVVVNSNTPVTINMVHHRKTQSLDTNSADHLQSLNNSSNNKAINNREGRFRCIVSYPPNSEFELELNVGDIVFVHRKQKNGWYKGTHSKTNKTGLFPASFVEPDL